MQSVLPSSGQPIAAGKDFWSRLSDQEAAAIRRALASKPRKEVLKPDEVIPPTVRGPEYGPHFSESRPVIETTGRVADPFEAEFRRRDAARAQREQIQSQLRAQTEAQVKSIPASTTRTTTDIIAAQRELSRTEVSSSTALVLARNQYADEYRIATDQLKASTTSEQKSVMALTAGGASGSGGLPPRPSIFVGGTGDDWEDEFRRREIARQQREQMRRWLDAEAARTLRPVSETEMNAYKWRQGVIANTPPGAERTRRLLSGSPVGPDAPTPKALRYVSEEEMNAYKWRQKVIDTVPPGAQRTKYLLGKDGQAQFEADQAVAKWRQNIMDTIPPGATRTKYLLGKDPFNLGSLDLTNNSGSGTPAAIAAFRRDVEADATRLMGPSLPEFKKSVRGMGGGRRGALDEQLDLAATIEPTQALASINEVLAQIGKLRTAVTTPMRLNFVSGASEQVKAEQSYVIQSLDEIEARANSLAKSKRAALPAATGGGEKTNDIPPTSTQGLESENKKTGATQSTPEVRGSIPTQDTLGTPPTFRDTAGVRREIKDHLAAAKRSLSDTDKLANVEAAEEKIRGLERSVNIPIGANTIG